MGSPTLWEALKRNTYHRRIPFKLFVDEFRQAHRRTPKIAIDAYSWLFECGFIKNLGEGVEDKYHRTVELALVSLLSRLKLFISLDITFVLVFDGPRKPSFKNQFKLKKLDAGEQVQDLSATDYGVEKDVHDGLHYISTNCYDGATYAYQCFPDQSVNLVRKVLNALNISFVDACGEGEAECSRLQKEGLVDFVLANDSDVFVFGATKVLRNFSKFWDDVPATYRASKSGKDTREYMLTIFDLDRNSDWNQASATLFCVLLGADYNQGVRGLGPKKSTDIALHKMPCFADELAEIFKDFRKNANDRRAQYEAFKTGLFNYCRAESKRLFGRKYFSEETEGFKGWPSDTAVMFYMHPLLNPELPLFCFKPGFVNVSGKANMPEVRFRELETILMEKEYRRISDLTRWLHEWAHEAFLLKKILYEKDNADELTKATKIVEEWMCQLCDKNFSVPCWRIRYNTFLSGVRESANSDSNGLKEPNSTTHSSPRRRSPTRRQIDKAAYKFMTSIPKNLIDDSHILVEAYQKAKEALTSTSPSKRSPRKRELSQKNNLDDFLKLHTSPRKPAFQEHTQKEHFAPHEKVFLDAGPSLFVPDEPEPEGNDSSLIILAEHDLDEQPQKETKVADSPKRKLLLSSPATSDNDTSPLKKHKQIQGALDFGFTKRQLFHGLVDLTAEDDESVH
ncbi:LAMI_0D02388g1_1 [Lachancea mirantina]|uniref:LAMI_0D02388g1_1 n=1 Tax=Lachancea mirantina TaxID=1230905 RepID=A0A1G4J9F1_9SACH|nr:LAMI_0D02388g1_1 [Lachancea mirantina]